MATPEFPSTLPGVSAWSLHPSEQVIATADAGPRNVRRRSRWPGATGQVAWTFVESDYSQFRTWWKDTLVRGHKKFWLLLPSAGGMTWHVAQFVGPYKARNKGYSAFDVTAELELEERQFAPNTRSQQYLFVEDFENGFSAYTSVSGNTSIFTVRDGMTEHCMHCAPQSSGTLAVIRRVLSAPVQGTELSFRVRITLANGDDGCILYLSNGAIDVFAFNPIREAFYDSDRRASVVITNGSGTAAAYYGTDRQLETGRTYKVTVAFSPVSGGGRYTVFDEIAGAVIYALDLPGLHPSITFDRIRFTMDSSGLTSETDYDDIRVKA